MNRQFEIGDLSPPKLFVGISAVLGLLFALITEPAANFFTHILQWQIQTTGAVIAILATHVVLYAGLKLRIPNPWVSIAISGVIGALVFSPIALLSDIYLGKENLENDFLTELFNEMQAILLPITTAWLAMNSPWLLGYRLWRSPEPEDDKNESGPSSKKDKADTQPPFLSLTKLASASDILYIKSELHYVSIVSAEGKELILLSLKDAITQLKEFGFSGNQCHRGYWVAHSAIADAHRSGRQGMFILSNGDEVPISRANVSHCLSLAESLKTSCDPIAENAQT